MRACVCACVNMHVLVSL